MVALRKKHLLIEALIQAIGGLLTVGGVVGLLIAAFIAMAGDRLSGLGGMVFAIFSFFLGFDLYRLRNGARIILMILICPVLTVFPYGTGITVGVVALLLKASVVCTQEYRQIIEATPEMRYTTSPKTWTILAILLTVVIGAMVWWSHR